MTDASKFAVMLIQFFDRFFQFGSGIGGGASHGGRVNWTATPYGMAL